MAKKINKQNIGKLLEGWAQEFTVFVPSRDKDISKPVKWDGKDVSFLEWYRNTTMPPKSVFFPLLEEMFRYEKDGSDYRVTTPAAGNQKILLFAVRYCDASAIAMLDTAFKDGYEDPYYLERRKNSVLIGLTCTHPYDSCFCTSLGGGPAESKNVDIMLTDTGDGYLVEAITAKGKELTAGLAEAAAGDVTKAQAAKDSAGQKMTRRVNTKDIMPKLQALNENKEFWEKAAAKCVSCGVCTFFCPTCFCFDITDKKEKRQTMRQRCWDSCQFDIYTKMPAENPREEKWRRVRQKVCHKYEFYPMSYQNIIACTGCGRCIRLCPVNWDITQVINSVPDKVTVESK